MVETHQHEEVEVVEEAVEAEVVEVVMAGTLCPKHPEQCVSNY